VPQSSAVPVAAVDYSWTFDPGPLLLVAVLLWIYIPRWRRVRAHDGPRGASARHLTCWLLGCLAIVAALVSPIDVLGEQAFVMHMVQHVLLLDVAPILLILGLSKVLMRPVTRRLQPLERRAGYLLHPAVAVVTYIAVMYVWHIPGMYDLALRDPTVHVLEHICFFTAGFFYWYFLLSPVRTRLDKRGMYPVVYMLATKIGVGLLGIALTFAPTSIYGFYSSLPEIWGLSASADQAAAGAVMALEQSIIMGIALAWLFVRALTESEREQQRREHLEDLEEERRAARLATDG
jgi:cytochrome c oxidase assembly factor CtaG